MTLEDFKTLNFGDEVIVTCNVKDHYGEVWHEAGDKVRIKSFTDDGVGVIFKWSDLGVHYKHIEFKEK
jgi:hypothetical protein